MPNTITSYTTFAPNTPAKSSEVNNNFSNYRGTLVPINTDTASSSDNTHDLGTSEHRWKGLWASELYAQTNSSLNMTIGGVTSTAFRGVGDCFTTDGSNPGIGGVSINPDTTTGYSVTLNSANTTVTSSYNLGSSTVTVSTLGRPVAVNFNVEVDCNLNGAGGSLSHTIVINSAHGWSVSQKVEVAIYATSTSHGMVMPITINTIDPAPNTATATYYVQVSGKVQGSNSLVLDRYRMYAYEIK